MKFVLVILVAVISVSTANVILTTCARMDTPILQKAAQGMCISSCSLQNCGTGKCVKKHGRPVCTCSRCAKGGNIKGNIGVKIGKGR